MKKKLLLLIFIFSVTSSIGQELWKKTNENRISSFAKMDRSSIPTKYDLYSLDFSSFKNQLLNAPLDISGEYSNHVVSFPNPNGEMEDYRIYEAPVMETDLSERYQDIKSYSGVNINKPTETIRFSTTIFGLHALVFSNEGTYYIDSYTKDLNTYILYKKQDVVNTNNFICGVEEDDTIKRTMEESARSFSYRASDGNFRTYRLAIACTIEYSAYHVNAAGLNAGTLAQKKAAVLAAMIVTMTRVNGVFEKDMSLRMNLVANNDLVIFIDSDSFDNSNADTLINQSQTVIDANIGAANYDIGHTFSTGGGGLAQLNSPCTANKARGITGSGAPVGDSYDIDYVAHELGHQWGATHTQNNNCNRTASTAVEPGSGSTIMGYAGICAPNVQNNSDDHFHAFSITQMVNFIAGTGGSCAVTVPNGNFAPVVNAGTDYTIPKGTPFILKGSATDANGDSLTYCWEQTNIEVSTQPPLSTAINGPNFRSRIPSISPDRYMPPLANVVAGNLSPTWEVVPTVARTMNFALTVRDNRTPNGSQTGRDDNIITVANVGPFLVSSPNTAVSYIAGSNQTVSWDVAGTTANGINCSNVNIYLSTNGGTSFPVLLASNVPNDGSEVITIPNIIGANNRIMVMGNRHIFYDVSNTNFSITASPSDFAVAFSGIENDQFKEVCQGSNASFTINYSTINGFAGTTSFSVTGNPIGTTATFSPSTVNATGIVNLNITNTTTIPAGIYEMTVSATSGATTKIVKFYLKVLAFNTMTLNTPADLAYAQPQNVTLNWTTDASATSYNVQVASDIDFSNIISTQNVTTNSFTISSLNAFTNYFWRVQPINTLCSGNYSTSYRFTTGQQNCTTYSSTNVPLSISASGTPTINSTLTIPSGNNVVITDINVTAQITHTWTEDLTLTLISPSGTQIQLVANQCGDNNNISATFDDSGAILVCGTTPAISGTIKPTQLLSLLNGQNSQGVWTLRVSDNAGGDGGSLTAWSLNICSVPNTPITCGQITTTWNGTAWSNGKPVDNVAATINGNYTSTSSLKVCSLSVMGTSQVTILSGFNLTVDGVLNIAPTASLTIENNSNLIQNQDVNNIGNIIVNRNTNPLKRLDYVIWSSPTTGTQTLKQFSPSTLDNRFYNYNTSTNFYYTVTDPVNTVFQEGNGYLIRMPNNHPTSPTIWNGQFNGVPNNGNVDVNLSYIGAGQSFNMVGNPYPSTIDATTLINTNTASIFGTIYFWRKTNAAAGTAYATYTLGGATTTSPTSPSPNGFIQVGQGFFVEAKNITTPILTFNNAMRVENNSNQTFRLSEDFEAHRVWLNLTSNTNPDVFSQMIVGYMSGATSDFDDSLDGKRLNDSEISLSSMINDMELTIQGRSLPFDVNDIIPLHFKTDVTDTYQISIDHVDGLFSNEQEVFIKDNQLAQIHNLSISPYNFDTIAGSFNSRFELLFQNSVLANPTFDIDNSVIASTANNSIAIQSSVKEMLEISIYDILGRQLYNKNNVSNMNHIVTTIKANKQPLFIKVKLINGEFVTKKIIF